MAPQPTGDANVVRVGQPITIYAMTEAHLLPAKTQRFIEFLRERLSINVANTLQGLDSSAS